MTALRAGAVLALLAIVVADAGRASATTVRATLDRQRAYVGEQVGLEIEVNGAKDAPPPELGAIDGFTVRYLGPATQVSIVQGRVSQSVTHRYALVAKRPGRFALGPFDVSVGGQTYRTETLSVRVVAQGKAKPGSLPQQAAGGHDLTLVLETGKREVFLHERIPITLTLYVGATRVDDVQYPRIESDAFSIEPFERPVQGRVRRGGKSYQTLQFETSIVPLRAGTLMLGPVVQSMSVLVSRRERDPFFGRFFGADIFTERQPREVHSNAEPLTVRPLPGAGRPPDFSGAVGQFDLNVSARPTELQANDPITLTIRITGTGNLSGVSPPAIGGPGFKTYPARSLKAEESLGARVLEQVIIPTSEDVTELPKISFSYFDPDSGAYRTVSRGPIGLVVHPSRQVATISGPGAEMLDAPGAGARAEELGRDIVYVKDTPGRMSQGAPWYLRPWFLAVQLLPLCCYLLALSVARRRERLRGDPRYARFARAGREARRAIAVARRKAASGETPAVYDGLARAVREYLSAKLDLPPGAIDAERVAKRIGGRESPVVRHVDQFFHLIEQVSYAPKADGAGDGRATVDLAARIVSDLERQRGLAERFGTRRKLGGIALAAALLGVSAVVAVADVSAERDPATRFFEANALYKAGRYGEAAQGYGALLAAGFQSGALHYNLGNALFKAGELGRAVLSYERARRLLPRDPDVRANLRFAYQHVDAGAAAAPTQPPLWLRLTVPLAFYATTGELVVATSALYVLAMLLLTLRLFLTEARRALGRAAAIAGVVIVITGTALGFRFVDEQVRTTAVVVRAGEVPVRFEPSTTGTVHFTLSEGVLVRRLAEREGWYQIRRADGRRGWIEADSVEVL